MQLLHAILRNSHGPPPPRCFPSYRRLKEKPRLLLKPKLPQKPRLLLKQRLLLKPRLLLKTNITGDDPIIIHLDNANEDEELPLAPWH